jgi:PE family
MSYVIAAPEIMASAATDLATIGSNLRAAHTAAGGPTLAVMPAAADEVSASIAQVFSRAAQEYQALAGKAAAFQEQFVQHLTAGAGSYVATEAANAGVLQPLTASAGSFTSVIATLQGQVLNLLNGANAALGQLVNLLPPGFLSSLERYAIDQLLLFLYVFVTGLAEALKLVIPILGLGIPIVG